MNDNLHGIYFLASSRGYYLELPVNYIVLTARGDQDNLAGAYYSQGRNLEPYYHLGLCNYLGHFSKKNETIELTLKSKYSNNTFKMTGEVVYNRESQYKTIYFSQKLSSSSLLKSVDKRNRRLAYQQMDLKQINHWRDNNKDIQNVGTLIHRKDDFSSLNKSESISALIDLLKRKVSIENRIIDEEKSLLLEQKRREERRVARLKANKSSKESDEDPLINKPAKKRKTQVDAEKYWNMFKFFSRLGFAFAILFYILGSWIR